MTPDICCAATKGLAGGGSAPNGLWDAPMSDMAGLRPEQARRSGHFEAASQGRKGSLQLQPSTSLTVQYGAPATSLSVSVISVCVSTIAPHIEKSLAVCRGVLKSHPVLSAEATKARAAQRHAPSRIDPVLSFLTCEIGPAFRTSTADLCLTRPVFAHATRCLRHEHSQRLRARWQSRVRGDQSSPPLTSCVDPASGSAGCGPKGHSFFHTSAHPSPARTASSHPLRQPGPCRPNLPLSA